MPELLLIVAFSALTGGPNSVSGILGLNDTLATQAVMLVSTVERSVASAAYKMEGGIDTLLIAAGPQVWGRVDPSSGVVEEVDEPSSDAENLLEPAVADTVLNDGKVHSMDASELPETLAAAILRLRPPDCCT